MRLVKRTYVLPLPLLEDFERTVNAGDRSAIIAQLLEDWLTRRKRDQFRQAIIEGCHDMADVYLEIEREYHPLEEESLSRFDEEELFHP